MYKVTKGFLFSNKLYSKAVAAFTVLICSQLLELISGSAVMAQEYKAPAKDTLAPWQVVMNEKNPQSKLYFKGVLILDGKVIRNGGYTLDTISPNSIRSVSVIKNVPADSILKYGEAAREGILILERN